MTSATTLITRPATSLVVPAPEPVATTPSTFRRYALITLVASPTNLVAFWSVLQLTDWHPAVANLAVASLLVPAIYGAYRRWVWCHHEPESLRDDVARFWVMTIVNVALASIAVAIAAHQGASDFITTATMFCSFAVLWLARFAYLDRVLFAAEERCDI